MYIIYLILSLLGIQAPYSTNENKHGDDYQLNSTQIAADILRESHADSESICLSGNTQLCSNGMVKQNTKQSTANNYGSGVVSVSDGKDSVVTFMPKSNSYRFDVSKIGGDIYDNLNKHLGSGVNSGYYDAHLNQIVLKRINGTTSNIPLPSNMNSYQLYDHMPVLTTSLKNSSLSLANGTTTNKQEDIGSMVNLKTELASSNTGAINNENNTACADGSSGGFLINSILCGSVKKDVPSTANNQTGGVANGGGIGGVGSVANSTDYPQENGSADDDGVGTDSPINVNYSSNGTMYMGSGSASNDNSDSDSDSISLNKGQHVPLTSNNINNCQNIMFPNADSTKSGANNLGYSYVYDYYIDLGTCNSYVRPSLDSATNNYAILINNDDDITDVSNVSLGWGYKLNDYVYYDWFGADDDGVGIRNSLSPTWNTNRSDCKNGIGTDIYNASYLDLEAMANQDYVSGTSNNLNACQDYGGANGASLGDVNSDITYVFSKVDSNSGPYLNLPFTYWGVNWVCYPDSQDRNGNIMHYHVTCVPNIPLNQQTNDYAYYGIWNQFIGSGHYPYGGLFSIGHKGSNNLSSTWPNIDDSSGDNSGDNSETDDDSTPQSGISGTGDGHYQGQAIGSYYPFLISGTANSDIDGVSEILATSNCTASNPANAPGIVPSGICNTMMNGILVARNKNFFNFEQSLLQSFSQTMSQNGWTSATSTLDGSVLNGTAGYPAQDSDGAWRWHLAPLNAPSFPTPSGNLLNSGSTVINKGDYFTYVGTVNNNKNVYTDNSIDSISNLNIPSSIGSSVNNGIGSNGDSVSNGYGYHCALGQFIGVDSQGNLQYDVNCVITKLPYVPHYISNGPPSGNLITLDTPSYSINKGDYFVYNGSVPLSIATGVTPASNEFITSIDSSTVPSYISWGSPSLVPGNSFSSGGFTYTCNLGERLGDYGTTMSAYSGVEEYSSYNIYCQMTSVLPPFVPKYISNPPPSGKLITPDTPFSSIKVGDYFEYQGQAPLLVSTGGNAGADNSDFTADGKFSDSIYTIYPPGVNSGSCRHGCGSIPSYTDFGVWNSIDSDDLPFEFGVGYVEYQCNLGQRVGDYGDVMSVYPGVKEYSLYNMYCQITDVMGYNGDTPYGNLITSSTPQNNVQVWDYFKYTAAVPLSVATNMSYSFMTDNEMPVTPLTMPSVPSYLKFFNFTYNYARFTFNGYTYQCYLGERLGDLGNHLSDYGLKSDSDYGANQYSIYNIYCRMLQVPYEPQYISNGPPSGNLITSNTPQNSVNVGDYFKYNGVVPFSIATQTTSSGNDVITSANSSNIPSYVGWNGQNILPGNSFTYNGYSYTCNLGERLGDYGDAMSTYSGIKEYSYYNMYCQMTQVPYVPHYISNGPPSGNLITTNTDQYGIQLGDYFKYSGVVPLSIATGQMPSPNDNVTSTDSSTVPSYIGWNGQSLPGTWFTATGDTLPSGWVSSNGYTYECYLGERLGDYGDAMSTYYGIKEYSAYNIYCKMNRIPTIIYTGDFGIPFRDFLVNSMYLNTDKYNIPTHRGAGSDKYNVLPGDYFEIKVKLPNTRDAVQYGGNFQVIDTSDVPDLFTFVSGYINGSMNPRDGVERYTGDNTLELTGDETNKIQADNGYAYQCNLEKYDSYDSADNTLIYVAACGFTNTWEYDSNMCYNWVFYDSNTNGNTTYTRYAKHYYDCDKKISEVWMNHYMLYFGTTSNEVPYGKE